MQKHFIYILILLAISFYGISSYYWVGDDAFISFRYARNLAEGYGLTYNRIVSEPIEGYSNLLWVLVSTPFEYYNIPSYQVIPSISIILALILVIKVYFSIIRDCNISPVKASLATLGMAAFPPFWVWATSGLETMAFTLFLFFLFDNLFLKKEPNAFEVSIFSLCTILIRAEGFAWTLFLLGSYLLLNLKSKKAWQFLSFGIIATLGLFIWRYGYYSAYLPNTASAKVGFSIDRLIRGFDYIAVYLLTFISPLIIFILASIVLLKQLSAKLFFTLTFFIAFFAYAVLTGGDFMSMGRFLAPTFPLQAILLAYVIKHLFISSKYFLPIGIATILIISALLTSFDIYLVPEKYRAIFHFRKNRQNFVSENEHWRFMVDNSNRWRKKGELLATISSPKESLVEGAIGNVGYFSKLEIFDRVGLVTRLKPKKKDHDLRSPGHDVRVGYEYFLKQNPNYIFAKDMGYSAFNTVLKSKNRYPKNYAPTAYETNYGLDSKKSLLVVMKYYKEIEEAENAWEKAKMIIKGVFPNR